MFERFTPDARRVLVLAQEEARLLGHPTIGTEHLLLGLIQSEAGGAGTALADCGVTLAAARREVERRTGVGTGPPVGSPPFTDDAKRALELGLRATLELGHASIASGHLLLGLLRQDHTVAVAVLGALGADRTDLEDRTLAALAALGGPEGSERRHGRRRRGFPGRTVDRGTDAHVVWFARPSTFEAALRPLCEERRTVVLAVAGASEEQTVRLLSVGDGRLLARRVGVDGTDGEAVAFAVHSVRVVGVHGDD